VVKGEATEDEMAVSVKCMEIIPTLDLLLDILSWWENWNRTGVMGAFNYCFDVLIIP